MGYYVTLIDSTAAIPADRLDECYKALCALNDRDNLKRGDAYQAGSRTERWFAWMDANYPETCEDAKAVFEALGFECEQDEPTDPLRILSYDDKTGQEELFLSAAAPFMEPGSTMEWQGEEGERWLHKFDGTSMTTFNGTVVYE
jgi:hypothetical protein